MTPIYFFIQSYSLKRYVLAYSRKAKICPNIADTSTTPEI